MQKTDIQAAAVRVLWQEAILLALVLFCAFFLYNYLTLPSFTMSICGSALAATAAVMMGWSNMLSGISYYFNFLDQQLGYRKYIGLVGYLLAVAYALFLIVEKPHVYLYDIGMHLATPDIALGLAAMILLTLIVIVANSPLQITLGYKNFRALLRMTYLAYFFLLLREYSMQKIMWAHWLMTQDGAMPLSLAVSLFAVCVFLLRGAMIVSQQIQKRSAR